MTNLMIWCYNVKVPLFFICRFIMSCPPSVCPSVYFSCPLHNSDTAQDIFMKIGTNINHPQTMCRKQKPTRQLHFLRNYGPLKFFLPKSCPLYNFDTVQNIFIKFCRNINRHQTMYRGKEPLLYLHFCRARLWVGET